MQHCTHSNETFFTHVILSITLPTCIAISHMPVSVRQCCKQLANSSHSHIRQCARALTGHRVPHYSMLGRVGFHIACEPNRTSKFAKKKKLSSISLFVPADVLISVQLVDEYSERVNKLRRSLSIKLQWLLNRESNRHWSLLFIDN